MDQFTRIIDNFYRKNRASAEECAEVFGRLITNAALEGDLPEHLAERWGTNAGHYGRLALLERERASSLAFARDLCESTVRMSVLEFGRRDVDLIDQVRR